jgi:PAS domain S-box-containing protein
MDETTGLEVPSSARDSIVVAGIPLAWNLPAGTCSAGGLPVALLWVDSTLAGLMAGVESMVGPERFVLALQAEGRKSVEEDWQVFAREGSFERGFEAIRKVAAVAGWGDLQLVLHDPGSQRCVFRVRNNWEGLYQRKLGVSWGSGFLAGKFAGYCSKLFGSNCWSQQTAFLARGDAYDEFDVRPSTRRVEHEIEQLLASDKSTRADLAVALRRLQASERRLRVILDNAPIGIWLQDSKGRLQFVNRAFCESVGISEERFLAVKHYSEIWDPSNVDACMESDAAARRTRGPHVSRERVRFVDGKLHDVETIKLNIARPDHDDELIGLSIDVSARLRAEEQKAELEAQLRQTQKLEAIGTLAGGIAHDFNNILAVIRGNTTLARNDCGAGHAALESLDEIQRACQRAEALVRQILSFGRPQASNRRAIRLQPVIEESLDLLRHTLPALVELSFAPAADVPEVLADPAQIGQILINLCTNAWHAFDDDPGRITIGLERFVAAAPAAEDALPAGVYACLSVRDTGHGMDAATLERIYEPFFTTKAPGRGTGLGLPVVHGIVRGHDGRIRVESEPGKGTCFTIWLPAAGAGSRAEPSARDPRAAEHGRPGQRILFLDDEEALVSLARRVLERLGHKVSAFTQPSEALAAFRADPSAFDLVVTDLNMPGVSGLDVAREMLALRPDLPLALASGYLSESVTARARALGIPHLLDKPGTVEEFARLIDKLTRAR